MYNTHYTAKLANGKEYPYDLFTCSTHHNVVNKAESTCSANTFSAKALRALLTDTIRTVSRYALENEDEFLQRLHNGAAQPSDDVKPVKKRIAALERRASELNRLLKKLYEDVCCKG